VNITLVLAPAMHVGPSLSSASFVFTDTAARAVENGHT